MDVEIIMRDNIIPKNWLFSVIVRQWVVTLRVNQNEEKGYVYRKINSNLAFHIT